MKEQLEKLRALFARKVEAWQDAENTLFGQTSVAYASGQRNAYEHALASVDDLLSASCEPAAEDESRQSTWLNESRAEVDQL